jgi:N-acetylornithine carbamoyltransferase
MIANFQDRFLNAGNFSKDLICTQEWPKKKLEIVLELAAEMKRNRFSEQWSNVLPQRSILLLFQNSSTRTRLAFEAAVTELGANPVYMNSEMGWFRTNERKGESIEDSAQVISGFMAALGIRLGFHEYAYYGAGNAIIREYAKWASVPVINMADDKFHPCQGLADVMGWMEWFGDKNKASIDIHSLKGKTILFTWAQGSQGGAKGSARPWNSIQESLLTASRFGMHIILARPDGYDLDPVVYDWVRGNCHGNKTTFTVVNDSQSGYKDADVVYSRNWASSDAYQNGSFQKQLEIEKASLHSGWITTVEKMAATKRAIFTHPMPVDRGFEVENEVASGPNSVIYNVARNRLHVQKALLALLVNTCGNSKQD